jgi:hypothetical protein
MNINLFESYNRYLTEEEHKLNSKLFDKNKQLIPEVREHLIEIVNQFLEDFNVELSVDDIDIIGSNARL